MTRIRRPWLDGRSSRPRFRPMFGRNDCVANPSRVRPVRRRSDPTTGRRPDGPSDPPPGGADDLAPGVVRFRGATVRGTRGPVERWLRRVPPSDLTGPIDLDVVAGRITAVVGPNGSGADRLLRLAAGRLEPTTGVVARALRADPLDGGVVAVWRGPIEAAGFRRHPSVTVESHLRAIAGGLARPRRDTAEVLALAELSSFASTPVADLPGPVHDRLGLAIGLVGWPELVVVEQPAIRADPVESARVASVLLHLAADGAAVLVATDDLAFVDAVADRLVVLDDGRCRYAGAIAAFVPGPGTRWRVAAESSSGRVSADELARLLGADATLVAPGSGPSELELRCRPVELSRRLGAAGVWVTELSPSAPTLVDAYEACLAGQSGARR